MEIFNLLLTSQPAKHLKIARNVTFRKEKEKRKKCNSGLMNDSPPGKSNKDESAMEELEK